MGRCCLMIIECWAIIVIIICMVIIFLRAKRKDYAFGIIPLMLVPFIHAVGSPIANVLTKVLPWQIQDIRLSLDISALVVTGMLLGYLAMNFKSKKIRRTFLVMCGGFSIILACVLIFKMPLV